MASYAVLPLAAMMMFSSYSGGSGYDGCPPVDDPNYTVTFPGPDCASFYLCNNGVAILMRCPDGLHYDADRGVCDWPREAGCIEKRTGTCCSYGWTGDSYVPACWVSKADALENFNWWNTPDKGWCCDSCPGLGWVKVLCEGY